MYLHFASISLNLTLKCHHLSNYSYKITVDLLKILPKLPQNVKVFVKSVKKLAYYAGIMLDTFVILLCSGIIGSSLESLSWGNICTP